MITFQLESGNPQFMICNLRTNQLHIGGNVSSSFSAPYLVDLFEQFIVAPC